MNGPPELILASTSPYRRMLMERLGLPFRAAAPGCDEEGLGHLPAGERATMLAARKAAAVSSLFPEAVVIGSDQIVEVDGETLSKPGTRERAREALRRLRGREHRLVTAVAIARGGAEARIETALDEAFLDMRDLTDAEIEAYLDREHVLDCAGAYRIEGLGAALFASIRTNDPTGIVGLPITRLVDLLSRFGVRVLG
ncbi:MAG: septum formation protein Maf [Candidatus Eisenbacteria bacterium]|nr:septum formation protein Maf [Candidatus Eisenbacteria bacterium]